MDEMMEIDRREFITRMKAMSKEQQILAVKELPSRVLWNELFARFISMERRIRKTEKALRMR